MFNKILLATDGSKFAAHAADAALSLASSLDEAQVLLVHVSEEPPSRSALMQSGMDVQYLLREKAQKLIAPILEKFTDQKITHRLRVALGDPADMIVEIADEEDIDLIIIGSRGLGSVGSLLLGSVSRQVSQEAACPVMIVK